MSRHQHRKPLPGYQHRLIAAAPELAHRARRVALHGPAR